jgi:hypothetical protein
MIGDRAITTTATTTIQMLMASSTIYVVSTPISAPLGFVQANPTIPNIIVRKLKNFMLDSTNERHGLSANIELDIIDEFML